MPVRLVFSVIAGLLALPVACGSGEGAMEGGGGPPVVAAPRPAMAWDHRPEAAEWTAAGLGFLAGPGAGLVEVVPADIAAWCPAYAQNGAPARASFWLGLVSALAGHESTWNPRAVGGGGRWYGLVQISPATARGYGCEAVSGAALQDGSANITCALRIMARTVARDGVVAAGGGGVAADWGPFSRPQKRVQMREWVARQAYCRGP